ncbi:nuclear factor erythroid 2-related factor 3 [Sorex araneus]|uniref:nuclear factor erythroid 2-related factor 3 n=1 Tax=Sorex araneus TaxID=42254 RepID=UPI00243392D6|nr:nuclear factor erythroid 2-related factor 3 [Sorex araneus]
MEQRYVKAPCPPRWVRLCARLWEPATAAARPAPLFRFSVSSGQVAAAAARGVRTCRCGGRNAGSRGRREMKYLKPWWSDGGGLLHLTILLSLAGLRVDLDLYLLLPPPPLPGDELLLRGGPESPAYALSPFPAWGGWGRADQLHPKGWEPDPAAPSEGRLLREVRTLGVPFIPRTRVDAWLVHSVAAGDPDGTHGLLGAAAAASSAGGVGAGVDGGSQAAPGGGGDPRAAQNSPLAAGEEETAPAEPTAQVRDAAASANENGVLRERHETAGHNSRQEENEQSILAQKEKSLLQKNEDENKITDKPDRDTEKPTESRNEVLSGL